MILFTVIQVLTSSIHFCMERRKSGMRGGMFLELRVIGVRVLKDRVLLSDSGKRNCVKNKEYKSKD